MASNYSSKNAEGVDISTKNIMFSVMKVDHVNLIRKVSSKISDYEKESTNINRGECSYKIEQVYVKSEPMNDEDVEDNTVRYTDVKPAPEDYNSGNVDSSKVGKVHDKDMFTQDSNLCYKTENIDIKNEQMSDNEHISSENLEDPFRKDATNHTAAAPYKCEVCEKAFPEMDLLNIHKWIHTAKTTQKCEECGKTFSRMSNLKRHLKLHAGEKPYPCIECGKAFSQTGDLNKHMRLHTGEKPYNCNDCGKAFSDASNLRSHMRLHARLKPYNCDECGKAFSNTSNLTRHMRLHTGEKPYSCSVCGKAFTQTNDLNKHMRLHTGEKPYNCNHCGKAFSDTSNLRSHMKFHAKH